MLVGAYFANEVGAAHQLQQQAALGRRWMQQQHQQHHSSRSQQPQPARRCTRSDAAARTPPIQAVDTGIASVWEKHNQGKLFKHMTIPSQDE